MATQAEIDTKVTSIMADMDAIKASVDKAVADKGTAISAGVSAVLDEVSVGLDSIKTKAGVLNTEIMTALETVPVPAAKVAAP